MNVGGSAGEMDGSDDEMRGKRVGLFLVTWVFFLI